MLSLPLTRCLLILGAWLCVSTPLLSFADGPGDNLADNVRPIPPPGIDIGAAERTRLKNEVDRLRSRLPILQPADNTSLTIQIEVLLHAVEVAVEQGHFFEPVDVKRADRLLAEATKRIEKLANQPQHRELVGVTTSADKPQLIVGGYRSRIDGSIQPYGLVVPAGWNPQDESPKRLDIWLHGRGEKSLELQFLDQRLQQIGQVSPANTFVLHPFGRYCNAFKFAGEIDVLEALEHVKSIFPIDSNRISIRGFSMGGAGCWQMAVHYPGTWFAATPGAGFSETTQFLKEFQKEDFQPSPAIKQLLNLYDCPGWANNLRLLPTIAYSGEIDKQKQAADMMAAAFTERGMTLNHVIGPQTAHKIHPDSLQTIEQWLADQAKAGRPAVPLEIDFTTFTLRHAQNRWITIEGLQEHWKASRIHASLELPKTLRIKTDGITQFRIQFAKGECPLQGDLEMYVDGMPLQGPKVEADGSLEFQMIRQQDGWWILDGPDQSLRKRPGLQGPIDDAFYDSFIFVRPSRPCTHGAVERWVTEEWKHALQQWKRHYRGEPRVVMDTNLTEEQIANSNLILFGCSNANQVLERIIDRLPLTWNKDTLRFGSQSYDPAQHVVAMIYPNPLNPKRYIVLNSGFTFREYAYLNNARQIPMLPDWAVIDVSKPADPISPGKIASEGFFSEKWQIK